MKIVLSAPLTAALLCNFHQVDAFTVPTPISTNSKTIATAALSSARISQSHSSSALKSATLNEVPTESIIDDEQQIKKSYLDDGFVFGLEDSGLQRPKGKVAQIVVKGDTLETQPYQRAMVATTFSNHAAISLFAMYQLLQINNYDPLLTAVQSLLCIVSSWAIADFGSGVLHWSVDNYGNGRTPVMGSIIAAFQGHHTAPWTITEREFCNNVHKLCIPFGIPTVVAISLLAGPSHPLVSLFFATFCSLEIMSQEFHKWSHMTKSQVPQVVNKLQDLGLTIGRTPHAQHHMAPFEGNYCIVSGFCNPVLDRYGIFRMMEHAVWKLNGVESNAWKLDPELKSRTLRGEYAQETGRRGGRS